MTRTKAILSLNRALLVEASPALRAALISWNDEEIHLFFYYDGEISVEDNESAECAATEVIAGYPEYALEIDILRWDAPKPIPQTGELVYHRREKSEILLSIPQIKDFIDQPLKIRIILSTIFALINEVSSALRRAEVIIDGSSIHLCFYYDGKIAEEDHLSVNNIASKMMHDFPSCRLKTSILRWDYPKWLPQVMGENAPTSVYQRKEEDPDKWKSQDEEDETLG
jgi:hypothetical protein